jgi:hypothetical protein
VIPDSALTREYADIRPVIYAADMTGAYVICGRRPLFPRPEFKSLCAMIIPHKLEAQAPETEMVSSFLGLE